jgi:hypothetical protein
MPWIADVAPYDTIQSLWGNTIRDHTVGVYASKAERDAQCVPKEGMVVHVSDTHITYVRVGSAWWVLAMPWRAYTPAAWAGTTTTTLTGLAITSPSVMWRQSMGACEARGSFTANLGAITAVNAYVWLSLPQTASLGGPVGSPRAYMAATGIAVGGMAQWWDNGGPGGTSRAVLLNVGNQVPNYAQVNVPGSNPLIGLDVQLAFLCDPTLDTP